MFRLFNRFFKIILELGATFNIFMTTSPGPGSTMGASLTTTPRVTDRKEEEMEEGDVQIEINNRDGLRQLFEDHRAGRVSGHALIVIKPPLTRDYNHALHQIIDEFPLFFKNPSGSLQPPLARIVSPDPEGQYEQKMRDHFFHTPLAIETPPVLYQFKEGSKLHAYLNNNLGMYWDPEETVFEIKTAVYTLKNNIVLKNLFDFSNPMIIECDSSLEHALDMPSFHIAELFEILISHLEVAGNKELPIDKLHEDFFHNHSVLFCRQPCWSSSLGFCIPDWCEDARASALQARHNLLQSPLSSEESYIVSPALLKVFQSISDANISKDQTIFTYREANHLLSQYIMENKDRLFDLRNVRVANIEHDLLGAAFRVRTMARCQITSLFQTQLTPLEMALATPSVCLGQIHHQHRSEGSTPPQNQEKEKALEESQNIHKPGHVEFTPSGVNWALKTKSFLTLLSSFIEDLTLSQEALQDSDAESEASYDSTLSHIEELKPLAFAAKHIKYKQNIPL